MNTKSVASAPAPMQGWLSSLPSENVGALYAKLLPPLIPIPIWRRVDGWGQLCDGQDHKQMVHLMLYNSFPLHGKGWTYVAWEAVPDNPEACKSALRGKVENPAPYSGVAYE